MINRENVNVEKKTGANEHTETESLVRDVSALRILGERLWIIKRDESYLNNPKTEKQILLLLLIWVVQFK